MRKYLELFLVFAKIGAFTFGGGYAMIAIIERECVGERGWLEHEEFMNMAVIAESTPGPVAINAATYVGNKRAGFLGAVFATVGVILPSFLILLLISGYFEDLLEYEWVSKAFAGIRVAVSVLIVQAGVRMAKKTAGKALVAAFLVVVLGLRLIGINLSVIVLILAAGLIGFFFGGKKHDLS